MNLKHERMQLHANIESDCIDREIALLQARRACWGS